MLTRNQQLQKSKQIPDAKAKLEADAKAKPMQTLVQNYRKTVNDADAETKLKQTLKQN
jgi:hypothetical protein